MEAKLMVSQLHQLVDQARNGVNLERLRQDVLELQAAASDLAQLLPDHGSESEAQSIIKTAAAGTGSHEVLTVLLANDVLSVLDGRLSLALAFLDHVARQLEEELSRSTDVEGHLTAIIFGTNVTVSIIDTADHKVKEMVSMGQANTSTTITTSGSNSHSNSRVRRLFVSLGAGFDVGLGGVTWTHPFGRVSFGVGGHASFSFPF